MLDSEPVGEQTINIRHVTLSEIAPQKDKPFDPQRDLTAKQWNAMHHEIESYSGRMWDNLVQITFAMNLIDHSQPPVSTFDAKAVEGIQQHLLDDLYYDRMYGLYAEAVVKVIQLGIRDKFDLHLDQKVWEAVKRSYFEFKTSEFFGHNINPYTVAQVLFPDRVHELVPLSDEGFYKLLSQRIQHMKNIYAQEPRKYWGAVSEALTQARLMKPDLNLKRAGIDNDFWVAMKEGLPDDFYGLTIGLSAAELSVIAADDIRITPDGIKLLYKRPKNHTSLPVLKAA